MKSEHKPLVGRTKYGDDTNFSDFLDELKDAVAGLIEELEIEIESMNRLIANQTEGGFKITASTFMHVRDRIKRDIQAIKKWLPDATEKEGMK